MNKIQDYHKFRAIGLNDTLSSEEKDQINTLEKEIENLQNDISNLEQQRRDVKEAPLKSFVTSRGVTLQRHLLAVDVDYSKPAQAKIFSHGKSDYKIWFLNSANKLCVVDKATYKDDKVYVTVTIDVKGNPIPTGLTLDNFLYLIEKGEFKITGPKGFIENYLKPYSESNYVKNKLAEIDEQILELHSQLNTIYNSEFYKQYDNLYKDTKIDVANEYRDEIKGEVRGTAPSLAQQERKKATIERKLTDVKSIWNSTLTDAEKAYLIGWLCKHITTLWIKVVDQGVSDKVLSKAYPDNIYGTKYREKGNSSGWDASSGIINVDTVENCPEEAIRKLSTVKHLQHTDDADTIFNGKSIRNLDLVLFLLSEYNEYGFKTGVRHLNDNIDVNRLKYEKFNNNIEDFDAGYNA